MKLLCQLRWLLILVCIPLAIFLFVLNSGSHVRNTPLMREFARIHTLCGKLALSSIPPPQGNDATNIDAFVRLGILTPDDAAFIREHNIKFYGFSSTNHSETVPVFETLFTNTRTPRRIIGYADGHAEAPEYKRRLETAP